MKPSGLLSWLGDRLNPILVKETRQALKSKQFVVTFALVLLAAWIATVVGVLVIGQDIWYGAQGRVMFIAYYGILDFALLVIVPFVAMRSLAGEHEEHTYELLSITTLSARQVVRGKLGSIVLQIIIYLSALSPCLAFTYLLRGIDFPTILFILGYTSLLSLGLAVLGLLMGTLTQEKHWQVLLSVAAVAGLLATGMAMFSVTGALLFDANDIGFREPLFWPIVVALFSGYVSYLVLGFWAAAARVAFASDNRALRLRVTMLVQQLLLVGWFAWFWLGPEKGQWELLGVALVLAGLQWFVMGALMTGESPQLSDRVKRRLPQSFFGRVFLTWFNPGPGTGYIFALAGMTAMVLVVLVGAMVADAMRQGGWASGVTLSSAPFQRPPAATANPDSSIWTPSLERWNNGKLEVLVTVGVLELAYMAIYLGLGLLLIRLLRRLFSVGILVTCLVYIGMLFLLILVPFIIEAVVPASRDIDRLVHAPNAFLTIVNALDNRLSSDVPAILGMVCPVAFLVFLLNLPSVAREVRQVRVERPWRVAEEDAQVDAEKHPIQPVRKSPWD